MFGTIFAIIESAWILSVVWARCDNPNDSIIPFQTKSPQNDINIVVQEHNKFRRLVADGKAVGDNNVLLPKAKNMGNLKWNSELATKSQELANRCIFRHVIPEGLNTVESVGQNLYIKESTAPLDKDCDYKSAIEAWFDEVKLYRTSQRKPFSFTEDTGHFTQMIWADTTDVGCACANYIQRNNEMKFAQIVVCDYGPAGNIIGDTIYETK